MSRYTRRLALTLALVLCTATGCGGTEAAAPQSGRTIEIFGPYRDSEADSFIRTLEPFEQASGIQVRYVGTDDFTHDLQLRVGEDNDPPDLAVVPQPGLVRQLVDDSKIVAPTADVDAAVAQNYPEKTADIGRIDGTLYAVPFRVNVKSLIWYRPSVFAEHGWTVPKTMAELDTLVDKIQTEGAMAPWCFSMAAGTSTGWTATDWGEDLVLRTAGTQLYQRWAEGEIPFSDPAIEAAFTKFKSLVLAPGRLAGGLRSAISTAVEDGGGPLTADPPGCALYKQADQAAQWMPAGTTIGADGDVDWFLLPGATATQSPPVLIGGDQIVQFRHSADIDALMAYLAGPDAGTSWAQEGGFLSPKSSISRDVYPNEYLGALADVVDTTPLLAFDASDQMPPDIGSDLLWASITDWVTGVEDYRTLADRVDTAMAADKAGTTSAETAEPTN